MSNGIFKLALCQIKVLTDWDETMAKAEKMVEEAAQAGADVVVFPETYNCPYEHGVFRKTLEMGQQRSIEYMSRWARENEVMLIGGTVPEKADGGYYNSCYVFDKSGEIIARHRKMHLFDVDLPEMSFSESAAFMPGSDITVFDTEYGRFGVAVCYDMYFPELFRAMTLRGAELVILPGHYDVICSSGHWDPLMLARAVENEIYVAGANPAFNEQYMYKAWGHSQVIGPDGRHISLSDEKEQIVYADIDLSRVAEIRTAVPTVNKLRRDVYKVSD